MALSDLIGKTFDCECGRTHTVPTEHLLYGADAIQRLPGIAAHYAASPVYALLADTRTYEAAGKQVEAELKKAGISVHTLILPDREDDSPITDDATFSYILEKVPPVEAFVAAGSGVVSDLTKWVAHERQKPLFTVPTAASMNGYASANVSATIEGLKVLSPAQACRGVFAVPEILENAPFELTLSGLGDVVAKTVSSADWKLNQFLFDEYYCQFSVDLLRELEPIYLNNPTKIRDRDPETIQALFEALFYSGVAMTITETSSPASGAEHLLSHTIDMLATAEGGSHDYHGRQVGLGTILSAALYERVLAVKHPVFKEVPREINPDFWGPLAGTVAEQYGEKRWKFEEAARLLSDQKNWDDLRSILQSDLIPAEKIKQCLKTAGGAHRVQDIQIDGKSASADAMLQIWVHANQMRSRFTVLDLAMMLGIMPDAAGQLLSEWA